MLTRTPWRDDRHHEGADRLDTAVDRRCQADAGPHTGRHAGERGSQSFNAVNQMRVLGRWMRMLTIPNQSCVAKAYEEFDEAGRMKPSSYYERSWM